MQKELKSILFGTLLLIPAFIICYALQWVLWKWLWLAIPIWIIGYLFDRKYGVSHLELGIIKLPSLTVDEIKKEWKKMNKENKKQFKALDPKELAKLSTKEQQDYLERRRKDYLETGKSLVKNLNQNVTLDHIEYVENGNSFTPLDDFFYDALRKREKWHKEYHKKDKFLKLTPKIERAIAIANTLHKNQYRKGYGAIVFYISHPLKVAEILSKYDADENTIIAGLLHDTIEDTKYTLEELENDFGKEVKKIVSEVTEDINLKKEKGGVASWEERKKKKLEHLKKSSFSATMVCCADHIDNLQSLIGIYEREDGANPFFVKDHNPFKFNAPMERQMWFHREILAILKNKLKNSIVDDLEKVYVEAKDYFSKHAAKDNS